MIFLTIVKWDSLGLAWYVTPKNLTNFKSMFNIFSYVIWLFDWFEWVELLCELAMCDFLDVDVDLYGVVFT